jgi:HEPN domain-containing protein
MKFSDTQIDILADLNIHNIEGRYPDELLPSPSPQNASEIIRKAEEIIEWLKSQL